MSRSELQARTEIANPTSFAAGAANLANRVRQRCGTGISSDRDTTPPRRDVAGLCASLPALPPRTTAKMAENPRLSWDGGEIRRETDCLLEGSGFELSVPRQMGNDFEALSETGPIGYRRRGLIRAVAGFAEYPD